MNNDKPKRKHTPGPWGLLDVPTHDTITVWQTKNPIKNFHIATCLDYASANKAASDAEFERCLANAKLIAAAPEMYEYLQKMHDAWMGKNMLNDGDLSELVCHIPKILKKARGEE